MHLETTDISCGIRLAVDLWDRPKGWPRIKTFVDSIVASIEDDCWGDEERKPHFTFIIFSDNTVNRNGEILAQELVDAGFEVKQTGSKYNPNSGNYINVWIVVFDRKAYNICTELNKQFFPPRNKAAA